MKYLLVFAMSLMSLFHDIHLSKTDIHYKTEQQTLQITSRIFLDDLEEEMLRKYGYRDLKLCTPYESVKGDSAIVRYINDHLKIEVDGNLIVPEYLGKEISDDYLAGWIYLEVPVSDPQSVKIDNTILLDLYSDQKNVVSVKKDYKKVSFSITDEENKTLKVSL